MLTTKRYAELLDFFGKRYDAESAKLLGHIPSTTHWMVTAGEMLLSQAARITELEAQLADAKQVANDCIIVADNAIAEALGAKKDAERYQSLRRGQKWSVIDGIGDTLRAEVLDEAIDDAAIQAEGNHDQIS